MMIIVAVCCILAACGREEAAATPESGYHYRFQAVEARFDSIAAAIGRSEFARNTGSDDMQRAALLQHIADSTADVRLQARALFWQIRVNQLHLTPDSAIHRLRAMLDRLPTAPDMAYDRAMLTYLLAGYNERQGRYFRAWRLIDEEVLPPLRAAADNYFLGHTHLLLALTYKEIFEEEASLEQLALAREHYARAGYPLNRILFFEANLNDALPAAERERLYAQSVDEGPDDPGMTLQALVNLSELAFQRGDTLASAARISEARRMLDATMPGNIVYESVILVNEARVALAHGKLQHALRLLHRLERYTEMSPGERWHPDTYMMLSTTYERLGDAATAFRYLKLYQQEYRRQMDDIASGRIPRAQERDSINRQKATILSQSEQLRRQRLSLWIVVLSSLLFLGASAGAILITRQRLRIRNMENAELQRSLEQRSSQVSTSTLLLANKNDVFERIRSISERYDMEGNLPRAYRREIDAVIDDNLDLDGDWERFKHHFENVHPAFYTTLRRRYPELSENDLRLCAYIRIGMRAKDIARMLSVSPGSVNTARYRMRRKMHLPPDTSLEDILREI